MLGPPTAILWEVEFKFFRLRFHFEAIDPVQFPTGPAANIFRGAFGTILREVACTPACIDALHVPGCGYARIFEPSKVQEHHGPSGLADWPRPFVFRTAHLDASSIPPGGHFCCDLHLFDTARPALSYFVLALSRFASDGFGAHRSRARLAGVEQLSLDDAVMARPFDGEKLFAAITPCAIPLTPEERRVEKILVRFVTPTELKARDALAERPDFSVLFARIRDRVSTLSALYGDGPLAIDFRAVGERAQKVNMACCRLQPTHAARRSSRTGQVHALSGFIGEAEYEGDLAEFLPFLHAARWTGVGRQTVWGKGEIRVIER